MIFKLGCKVTVGGYTQVEADTLEEAIAIAETRDMAAIFVQGGYEDSEYWIVDELDGMPQEIEEE